MHLTNKPRGHKEGFPPTAPKEVRGVKDSIFGAELSERLLWGLVKKSEDKGKALMEFMDFEAGVRASVANTVEECNNWQDAKNVFPVRWSTEEINRGEDVKMIKLQLESSKEKPNIDQRKALADIYFTVRKKVFPDAPFPGK